MNSGSNVISLVYLKCVNLFGHMGAADASVQLEYLWSIYTSNRFTAESGFIHSAVVFVCTSVLFCVRC